MDETTSFAERLVRLRDRIKISQDEAARRAGVSSRSWWNWEHGKGYPGVDDLPKLATALGCEPIDLVPPAGVVKA